MSALLNRPVTQVLSDYLGNSIVLMSAGLGLGVVLSLAGGLAHGAWYRRWPGKLLGVLEILLYAMPGFVIATFLILAWAGWLPPGGIADLHEAVPSLANRLRHLVLPALSLGLITYAGLARFLAESVDAEFGKPYGRTAAAKGLGRPAILMRHILRNALRPLVTLARSVAADPVCRQHRHRKRVLLSGTWLAAVAQCGVAGLPCAAGRRSAGRRRHDRRQPGGRHHQRAA